MARLMPLSTSTLAGALLVGTAGLASLGGAAAAEQNTVPPTIRVTIPPMTEGEPFTGWMTLYLIGDDAELSPEFTPADGPFVQDPQPMYSMYVDAAEAGDVIEFRPTHGFPGGIAEMPAGRYRAQVVLDMFQKHTSWVHEYGNLYSPIRRFEVGPEADYIQFPMLSAGFWPHPEMPHVEVVEVPSPTMSVALGEDVRINVGVMFPKDYNPDREYPAVYLMPGFAMPREYGGDEREAYVVGLERIRRPDEHHEIWEDAFLITVSPQAAWGHSMFVDSPANGPVETALLTDVIPALEERFPLVAKPEARLLTGHGAGGWAAIWLQMNHPDTFGGAWATSPDPVDFRAFMNTDIYNDTNFFENERGQARGFYRSGGVVRSTNEEVAAMEEVMGPNLTSAKQLAGWQAAFGAVADDGRTPVRLFDPMTGAINPAAAQAWRDRDITDRLRSKPDVYGPVFRDSIHIVAGGDDNFSFNKAVSMLANQLRELGYVDGAGYVEVHDDLDFGAVETQTRMRMFDEMRATFGAGGLLFGGR